MTDALAHHVESGEMAGLVAVVGRGTDIDTTVLGDQAIGGAVMRQDSLFRIASAGKPITAVAVLTLVADGLFLLHMPVASRSRLHPSSAGTGGYWRVQRLRLSVI